MEIKVIDSQSLYEEKWRELKLHILQSWAWGEVKRSPWKTLRLGLFDNGKLLNVISVQNYVKALSISRTAFGYIPKIRKWSGGVDELITYLKEDLKLDFVIIEPDDDEQAKVLSKAGIYNDHIQPLQTNVLRLAKTEDELFMQLKGNYRRNIKKAEREGVSVGVFETGKEALDKFYDVLSEIFRNTKLIARDKSYFEHVWFIMSQAKLARILTAEYRDKTVGAYFVAYDELGAYELYGGVTEIGRDHEAGYILKWRSMITAKALGKQFYDHWGVAPRFPNGEYDKNDDLHNISKFKEGFGGEYVQYQKPKVIVFKRVSYYMFVFAKSLRNFLMRLRKKL